MNELITLMGDTLLRQLLTNIRAVRWFSVVADETRDISNSEQLAIIIRWGDMRYDIHEDVIGMVHVPDTTSADCCNQRCVNPLYSSARAL